MRVLTNSTKAFREPPGKLPHSRITGQGPEFACVLFQYLHMNQPIQSQVNYRLCMRGESFYPIQRVVENWLFRNFL